MTNTYTVVAIPDHEFGGYVAYVPAIPNCVVQGETLDDALTAAHDAAIAMTEIMVERGEDIPVEPFGETVITAVTIPVPSLAVSPA